MLLGFAKYKRLQRTVKPISTELLIGTLFSVCSGIAGVFALLSVVKLLLGDADKWLLIACISWLLAATFAGISAWLSHNAEAKFSAQLRIDIARQLSFLPVYSLVKYRSDKLKKLINDDVANLHYMIAHLPSELTVLFIIPVITLGVLLYTTHISALVALIPGGLAILCYLFIIPRLAKKQVQESTNVMAQITGSVTEYSKGVLVCRTTPAAAGPLARLKSATTSFTHGMKNRVKRVATIVALATAMLQAVATYTLVYWIGSQWEIDSLAPLMLFSLVIVAPALKLGHGLDYIYKGKMAAKDIEEFLNIPTLVFGEKECEPIESNKLVISDLSLQINNELRQQSINLSAQSGSLFVISGQSGVGKSSLLRAIAGFEPAYSGRIYINSENIKHLTEHSLNKLVMLLPQGLSVLDATVQDNLALTGGRAAANKYLSALQSAQLNVDLSQQASALSGGEKQRLNLARAFLSEAAILLLDEPTSALDDETSMLIIQALQQHALKYNKIIIIVSHDPEISLLADDELILKSNQGVG
ncbi:ABC transporter ATP-binding protein/permease [Pseudoalteromonas sp. SCSIO 43095]|uniref:ATP-binding cassette domain-containing protein n=1 Tax=Pseudoalteromonas TaxID=53246 RepID=UPI000447C803|nr:MULTISPECIES: ABC transporter ATP-binding protein [Pseudoalteromonas]EWS98605.1 ABC transporter [Pseudoalteromonas sp. SCSIO_11900]EWS99089.1 ABC transporter [Pseudoalteromonas sp. SCSIO_11900]MBT2151421.1 ABC transporter ATP-binding protein/permease [Pseudoalteromonas tetraodonis]MDX1726789.1 ABC transporter ATP-binding protein [Pseudoalteromonas tetraodonis]URQ98570.1 ABC transporter ATP-binding protein/permease [Pseudoalteromonas sp. SCSIO 43095]